MSQDLDLTETFEECFALAKSTVSGPAETVDTPEAADSAGFQEQLARYQVEIGQKIQSLRKEHGLKQVDVARKVRMNSGAFFVIEAGRNNVTLRTLLMIANGLGVHVTDLFPAKPQGQIAKKELRLRHTTEAAEEALGRISSQLRTLEELVTGDAAENIVAGLSVQVQTLESLIAGLKKTTERRHS